MTSEQAFDILGIRDRDIDEATLKKAFYSAARRTHPDSNPDDAGAEDKFRLINEAYAVLSEYIRYQNAARGGTGPGAGQAKAAFTAYNAWNTGRTSGTGRTFGKKPGSTSGASSAAGKKTGAAKASASSGKKQTGTAKASAGGKKTGGAARASASSGKKQGCSANASASGGKRARRNTSVSSGKDIWTAYNEADIRFAKQRHEDASEKAAETIRNHMKMESEQAAYEARREQEERERRAMEELERLIREEQAARARAREAQSRNVQRQKTLAFLEKAFGGFLRFWNAHIASNHRLRRVVFRLLILFLIVWSVTEMIGVAGSIAHLTYVLAVIAKWGLIVWISGIITAVVHKNWKNRVLSTFAFMISMELLIILMNWAEDLVRSLELHLI